jgi:HD superfamily phosphodiesterase
MFTDRDKNKLDEICFKYYLGRDKSHGIDHIQKVLKNVQKISEDYMFSTREEIILRSCALLHDAYDHKYFQKEEGIIHVKQKITNDLIQFGLSWNEIQIIFIIINSISFSKEKEKRLEDNNIYYELIDLLSPQIINIRNIVSDADKIEALGAEGINRMILFSLVERKSSINNGTVSLQINDIIDDIKKLCKNKLYILISENYIRTDIGREIAGQKLEELKKITDNDDTLKKFVINFLN